MIPVGTVVVSQYCAPWIGVVMQRAASCSCGEERVWVLRTHDRRGNAMKRSVHLFEARLLKVSERKVNEEALKVFQSFMELPFMERLQFFPLFFEFTYVCEKG